MRWISLWLLSHRRRDCIVSYANCLGCSLCQISATMRGLQTVHWRARCNPPFCRTMKPVRPLASRVGISLAQRARSTVRLRWLQCCSDSLRPCFYGRNYETTPNQTCERHNRRRREDNAGCFARPRWDRAVLPAFGIAVGNRAQRPCKRQRCRLRGAGETGYPRDWRWALGWCRRCAVPIRESTPLLSPLESPFSRNLASLEWVRQRSGQTATSGISRVTVSVGPWVLAVTPATESSALMQGGGHCWPTWLTLHNPRYG